MYTNKPLTCGGRGSGGSVGGRCGRGGRWEHVGCVANLVSHGQYDGVEVSVVGLQPIGDVLDLRGRRDGFDLGRVDQTRDTHADHGNVVGAGLGQLGIGYSLVVIDIAHTVCHYNTNSPSIGSSSASCSKLVIHHQAETCCCVGACVEIRSRHDGIDEIL